MVILPCHTTDDFFTQSLKTGHWTPLLLERLPSPRHMLWCSIFFFLPSISLSLILLSPVTTPSLEDHLWKLTPRRKQGRHGAKPVPVILLKRSSRGVCWGRATPRRREENQGAEARRNSPRGNDPKPACPFLSRCSQPSLTSFRVKCRTMATKTACNFQCFIAQIVSWGIFLLLFNSHPFQLLL